VATSPATCGFGAAVAVAVGVGVGVVVGVGVLDVEGDGLSLAGGSAVSSPELQAARAARETQAPPRIRTRLVVRTAM
jgi:hypothetical protein